MVDPNVFAEQKAIRVNVGTTPRRTFRQVVSSARLLAFASETREATRQRPPACEHPDRFEVQMRWTFNKETAQWVQLAHPPWG